MAEPTELPFWMWTRLGPKNYVLDGGLDLPQRGTLLRGMMLGFSCVLPSTVTSGRDVGISPHAVNQHSDWPAAETVECQIKFSQ